MLSETFNVPGQLDEARRKALADPVNGATAYGQFHAAAVLSTLAGQGYEVLGPAAFKQYRDVVISEAAKSPDRLTALMLEQILWAHQRVGDLLVASANQAEVAATAVLTAAAGKLMAECRRTALAMRDLRAAPVQPHLTLVQQQNVAAGDQQIAMVESAATQEPAKKSADTELSSNPELPRHVEQFDPLCPANRRKAKQIHAERVNARREAALARNGHDKPPVDAFDRPEDGGR